MKNAKLMSQLHRLYPSVVEPDLHGHIDRRPEVEVRNQELIAVGEPSQATAHFHIHPVEDPLHPDEPWQDAWDTDE